MTQPWDESNVCYKVPCDDVSGDWILLDRNNNATGTSNDFVVLGTVSIEQSACHTPMLTLTNANGTVTTYYALLVVERNLRNVSIRVDRGTRRLCQLDVLKSSKRTMDHHPLLHFFKTLATVRLCNNASILDPLWISWERENRWQLLGRNIDKKWSVGDVLSGTRCRPIKTVQKDIQKHGIKLILP